MTTSVSAQASADKTNSSTQESRNTESLWLIQGGDPTLVTLQTNGKDTSKSLHKWKVSVKNNPQMAGFHKEGGLTGIWELCDKEERKVKLEEYYEEYLAQVETEILAKEVGGFITDIQINIGNEDPEGYERVAEVMMTDAKKGERKISKGTVILTRRLEAERAVTGLELWKVEETNRLG